MHLRGHVRNALAATLVGLSTTGARVTVSRVYPDHLVDEGPSLSVYLDAESVALADAAGGDQLVQHRVGDFVVELRVLDTTVDLDAVLDASALEVETAIMADPELGGLCSWVELSQVQIEREADREQPLVVQRMLFQAVYHPDAQDPQL